MTTPKTSFTSLLTALSNLDRDGTTPTRNSEDLVFKKMGWTRSQYQTKAQKFDEETFLKFEDCHDCT